MEKIKYKAWEHLANSLITISIVGFIVTFFVETTYAKKYKWWLKKVFLPLSKKLAKSLIDELGQEKTLELSKKLVDQAVREIPVSKETKELINLASEKVIKKAIAIVEKKEDE